MVGMRGSRAPGTYIFPSGDWSRGAMHFFFLLPWKLLTFFFRVLPVAAAALLWRVAWLCGGWRETNGAGVERGCCILWSNEEEKDWLAARRAGPGGEVGRGGRVVERNGS
jgi:hypothetical protein